MSVIDLTGDDYKSEQRYPGGVIHLWPDWDVICDRISRIEPCSGMTIVLPGTGYGHWHIHEIRHDWQQRGFNIIVTRTHLGHTVTWHLAERDDWQGVGR